MCAQISSLIILGHSNSLFLGDSNLVFVCERQSWSWSAPCEIPAGRRSSAGNELTVMIIHVGIRTARGWIFYAGKIYSVLHGSWSCVMPTAVLHDTCATCATRAAAPRACQHLAYPWSQRSVRTPNIEASKQTVCLTQHCDSWKYLRKDVLGQGRRKVDWPRAAGWRDRPKRQCCVRHCQDTFEALSLGRNLQRTCGAPCPHTCRCACRLSWCLCSDWGYRHDRTSSCGHMSIIMKNFAQEMHQCVKDKKQPWYMWTDIL